MKCRISKKFSLIKIFPYLKYEEIVVLQKNCLAALIPLSNSLRDISRFPHKVGEYLASRRPIITTVYGEPAKYLKDNVSAFIAEDFDPKLIAVKMKEILYNPDLANKVGIEGFKVCLNHFHYGNYSRLLNEFLSKI